MKVFMGPQQTMEFIAANSEIGLVALGTSFLQNVFFVINVK